MQVECSTVGKLQDYPSRDSADALPDSDFTSKVLLDGLPSARIFSTACGLTISPSAASQARLKSGIFAPRPGAKFGLVRLVRRYRGQGWGIDPSRGGMRTYRTMLENARTSSFIPAITSMPIARCHRN